jgi:hypothetical protein
VSRKLKVHVHFGLFVGGAEVRQDVVALLVALFVVASAKQQRYRSRFYTFVRFVVYVDLMSGDLVDLRGRTEYIISSLCRAGGNWSYLAAILRSCLFVIDITMKADVGKDERARF